MEILYTEISTVNNPELFKNYGINKLYNDNITKYEYLGPLIDGRPLYQKYEYTLINQNYNHFIKKALTYFTINKQK